MIFLSLRSIVFLALTCILSIIHAVPINSSAESSGSSGRKLINIQQRFTREYSYQDQETTDDNTEDPLAPTVVPQPSADEDLPTVQEEQMLDDNNHPVNSVLQVATEPAFQTTPVATSAPEALLFYPPVDQLKYRPPTYYGLPADSNSSSLGHSQIKTSHKTVGSSAPKLRQLGFPPISNTRENLSNQVNWAAKIGRSPASFHEFF